MTTPLIDELAKAAEKARKLYESTDQTLNKPFFEWRRTAEAFHEAVTAADWLSLSSRVEALEGALKWYGEQARLCRLIHSEGDAGRKALSDDGGRRAAALSTPKHEGEKP